MYYNQSVDCTHILASGTIPDGKQAVGGALVNENLFVIFGGGPVEGPYSNRLYKLNLATNEWSEPAYVHSDFENTAHFPPPRGVMAITAHNNKLYMFGGYSDKKHLNDFYEFDFNSNQWRQINAPGGPLPRRGASLVAYQDKLYLYGGSYGRGAESSGEIFSFDLKSETWTLELASQVGSYRHSAVVYKDQMIVFGGDRARGFSNHTAAFCFKTKSFQLVETKDAYPPPMEAHCAAVFGDDMVLYGGLHMHGFNNQVFVLNLFTKKWRAIPTKTGPFHTPGPGSRIFFAAGADENKLVVFGGRFDHTPINYSYYNDTWVIKLLHPTTTYVQM